jgi:hypothetical protein
MKEIIRKLLRENININSKKQYLGQCDLLRRNCANEEYWQDMMKNRVKIEFDVFLNNVNMEEMLDADENPYDYIKEALREDRETAAYKSNWGDKECMFLQTAGFEFIFI